MLNIKKQNVIDENNNIVSVILDYADFLKIEEAIENYGLAKLIDEAKDEGCLEKDAAKSFYEKLKDSAGGS